MTFEAAYLGQVDYQKAEIYQYELHQLVQAKGSSEVHIMGLEHPAVVTLGYRLHQDNQADQVIESRQLLIPQVQSSRGGLATVHSEGQLVIYPIVPLKKYNLGVRDYVLILLQTTQDLLKKYHIESFIDEKSIGLYTSHGKIAFCGIQIKSGITLHGISLNVRNDLSLFEHIISCGVKQAKLDKMQNYQVNSTLSSLFHQWVEIFWKRLSI